MDNKKKNKRDKKTGQTFLKENKTFKVNPELESFLENVLIKARIDFVKNGDGTISTPISGELFHKFVIRARCEKLDYEREGLVITAPHVHVSELNNPHVMQNIPGNYIVIGEK